LKNLNPRFAARLEGAAQEYTRMESMMGISTSRMLESMTNIDRWAVVGLMELVRNAPGIRLMPLGGWRLLQLAPFLIGQGESGKRLTLPNGTSVIPIDAKNMSGYLQDAGYLSYIYLTGHALNQASPLLYVALASHAYNIVRLCNVTEQLKEKMPLFAEGLEETARTYIWIEENTPAFTGKMLESMTSMDSWALVGLADLIRRVPGVRHLAGKIPVLSHLIANDRGWSFTRYAPIFFGGALQAAGLAFNIQQRLLGF